MAETKIVERQIADQSITDAKVKSGAAIATSKLADGANFLKKDGSVTLTGNLNLGSQKIVSLQTGTGDNDAVNVGQLNAAVQGLNSVYKYRNVRAASTGNVNISNPGTAVFDGVTLTAGERIVLRAQTAPAENGIYVFDTSSTALVRANDADSWAEFPGSLVSVNEGTVYADARFFCPVNDGGTLGTTAITYTQDVSTGLTSSNFVDKETPSGAVNGSNADFTLANTPTAGSEHVYLNGILQESGGGNDYTITGAVITMLTAPLSGEKIRVSYRK